MPSYVSADVRRLVVERAEQICEYCLVHEHDTNFGCSVDHIISEKNGRLATADNTTYACMICNRHRGSDLGSVVGAKRALVRFFNPRKDRWAEHFILDGAVIRPIS